MKCSILSILLIIYFSSLQAQKPKRVSLEVNYGLNGNFFVRSYNETIPPPAKLFYKKNFIGSIGGVEVKYNISSNSSINLGYAKSVNKKEINYNNGVNGAILHFNITHTNHFYQLFYERYISKKLKHVKIHGGLLYLRMNQQEVDASSFGVFAEERDYKHNKLEEGGVFLGFQYLKKIDTKFDLGIKIRAYYLISVNMFEAITLTPTLTYNF